MKAVQFDDQGRTFVCESRSSPATPGTLWWWLSITGEAQRYAAFRTEPGDTAATLKPRVIAYYAKLLEDRARPRIVNPSWAQRRAMAKPAEGAQPPEANNTPS